MGKQRLEKADIHPGSVCGQAVEPGSKQTPRLDASSNFAYTLRPPVEFQEGKWGHLTEGPGLPENSTLVLFEAHQPGAGKMARLEEHLPCKHRDLAGIYRTQVTIKKKAPPFPG